MSTRITLVVGLSVVSAVSLNAGERLTMRVSPAVAFAPATVTVRTTIETNPENRAIQIVAESPEFYRSSEIPLAGEHAPRTTTVEFRSLPGGMYTVTAVLIRVNNRTTASQQLNVVGRGVE
jgi:hypothetical protein